jgi:hypothetical protein
MTLSICKKCKGVGYNELHGYLIPCVNCNTRGVVSDQLYDEKLSKIPGK